MLKEHLQAHKHKLVGEWIKNNSSYDNYICDILNMELDTCRYWDAKYNTNCIEFKKGKSIWIDLLRYSEIVLQTNKAACNDTFTLFFIPNKEKNAIVEIIGVDTKDIINHFGITKKTANNLIDLKNSLPRSLNTQASLTVNDVRSIASFII